MLKILAIKVGRMQRTDMDWVESTTPSRLSMASKGRGLPLIVTGGGPGISSSCYRKYLNHLSGRFTVHLWDPPGLGPSPSRGRASFHEDVRCLLEIISFLDLESSGFALLGHSYGGLVTLQAALERPEGLRALILVNGAADLKLAMEGMAERKQVRLGDPDWNRYGQLLAQIQSGAFTEAEKMNFLELEFRTQFLSLPAAQFSEFMSHLQFDVSTFLQNTDWVGTDLNSRLTEILVPALVMTGKGDIIVPTGVSRGLTRLPRSEIVKLSDCGHWPFVENPLWFDEAIRRFVEKHRLQRSQGPMI